MHASRAPWSPVPVSARSVIAEWGGRARCRRRKGGGSVFLSIVDGRFAHRFWGRSALADRPVFMLVSALARTGFWGGVQHAAC